MFLNTIFESECKITKCFYFDEIISAKKCELLPRSPVHLHLALLFGIPQKTLSL